MKQRIFLFLILYFLPEIIVAHNTNGRPCKKSYNQCRSKKKWQKNSQSCSAALIKGQPYEVTLVVYKDVEYRIAVCTDDQYASGQLEFEIYEMERKAEYKIINGKKRRVYSNLPKYLLKNSEADMVQDIEFISKKTRKLTLKITVPSGGAGKKNVFDADDYSCVGVLLQHQRSTKTGF